MAKPKKDVFSVTKAVKANARERVGQPRPEIPLPTDREKAARRTTKHKQPLSNVIERAKREE